MANDPMFWSPTAVIWLPMLRIEGKLHFPSVQSLEPFAAFGRIGPAYQKGPTSARLVGEEKMRDLQKFRLGWISMLIWSGWLCYHEVAEINSQNGVTWLRSTFLPGSCPVRKPDKKCILVLLLYTRYESYWRAARRRRRLLPVAPHRRSGALAPTAPPTFTTRHGADCVARVPPCLARIGVAQSTTQKQCPATACDDAAAGIVADSSDAPSASRAIVPGVNLLGEHHKSRPRALRRVRGSSQHKTTISPHKIVHSLVQGTGDSGQMNLGGRWGGRRRLRDGGRNVGDGGGKQATFESPTWYDF
ncbi:hypothetical protein FB451DRAFT_1173233 [Mycena latifolia]|nr:hypothetical protein FB451DRAFT_1173233 [Mycena latifolia]